MRRYQSLGGDLLLKHDEEYASLVRYAIGLARPERVIPNCALFFLDAIQIVDESEDTISYRDLWIVAEVEFRIRRSRFRVESVGRYGI